MWPVRNHPTTRGKCHQEPLMLSTPCWTEYIQNKICRSAALFFSIKRGLVEHYIRNILSRWPETTGWTRCWTCGLPLYWLTHWGRDTMDAISQTTFSNAFSWMKMFEFRSKFHWSLFLRVQLIIFQHWFRQWLGADQATNHYLKQWLLTHMCVTRPQ